MKLPLTGGTSAGDMFPLASLLIVPGRATNLNRFIDYSSQDKGLIDLLAMLAHSQM